METPAGVIGELIQYARMAWGVGVLALERAEADPIDALRQQMARREEHFLDLAQRVVFSNPRHPYHQMFRIAGCSEQDLIAEVRRNGLEPALEKLLAAGVYLTHDEFKGKTPVVRDGREMPCGPRAVLNPLVRANISTPSSGSRSPGIMTPKSTRMMTYRDAYHCLQWREFGLRDRTGVQIRPILPSTMGLGNNLMRIRSGYPPAKWFAQSGRWQEAGHYRAVTHFLVRVARGMGAPVPLPDYLPENDFSPVARWIAERKREGASCVVRSYVSPAVRVAAAAQDAKLDIAGTIFLVTEKRSPTRSRRPSRRPGARRIPNMRLPRSDRSAAPAATCAPATPCTCTATQ